MADSKYRQIADDLRRRIESGELGPGSKLPTEPMLGKQYGDASRNTVREAIKFLVNHRLVETRAGQGTFVVGPIVPIAITMSTDSETGLGGGEGIAYMSEALAQSRKPEASVPRVEIQHAEGALARELGLPGDDPDRNSVVSRHQRLRIDDKPWSMQTSFYPMALVEAGATKLMYANDIQPGAVHYVREAAGLTQIGYRDKVKARPPHADEVDFFKLPDSGVAIIETTRTAYGTSGPIRCTVTVWPADRNILVYNLGEVPGEVTSPAGAGEPANASGPGPSG
jgi:GntR family transcriptional regulator